MLCIRGGRGRGRGRGRGQGRGRGGRGGAKPATPTVDELNADLDAYKKVKFFFLLCVWVFYIPVYINFELLGVFSLMAVLI